MLVSYIFHRVPLSPLEGDAQRRRSAVQLFIEAGNGGVQGAVIARRGYAPYGGPAAQYLRQRYLP